MPRTLSRLFTWRGAVADSTLPPAAKLLALVLSMHMSERGDSCFPSIDTLVAESSMSRRTVIRALARLESDGFLVKVKGGGRGRPNRYQAQYPTGYPQATETVSGWHPLGAETVPSGSLNSATWAPVGRKALRTSTSKSFKALSIDRNPQIQELLETLAKKKAMG